jgi:hypothetical protein
MGEVRDVSESLWEVVEAIICTKDHEELVQTEVFQLYANYLANQDILIIRVDSLPPPLASGYGWDEYSLPRGVWYSWTRDALLFDNVDALFIGLFSICKPALDLASSESVKIDGVRGGYSGYSGGYSGCNESSDPTRANYSIDPRLLALEQCVNKMRLKLDTDDVMSSIDGMFV